MPRNPNPTLKWLSSAQHLGEVKGVSHAFVCSSTHSFCRFAPCYARLALFNWCLCCRREINASQPPRATNSSARTPAHVIGLDTTDTTSDRTSIPYIVRTLLSHHDWKSFRTNSIRAMIVPKTAKEALQEIHLSVPQPAIVSRSEHALAKRLTAGQTSGITIGSVAVGILIIVIGAYILRRRQLKRRKELAEKGIRW